MCSLGIGNDNGIKMTERMKRHKIRQPVKQTLLDIGMGSTLCACVNFYSLIYFKFNDFFSDTCLCLLDHLGIR